MNNHRTPTLNRHARQATRRGFTLLEITVVLIVIGVLISLAAPRFDHSLEQSRADVAGANLRSIWSAEKIYWLDHHAYASELSDLQTLGLVDPLIVNSVKPYTYAVNTSEGTFNATATRSGSERWSGVFIVDDTGALSGMIESPSDSSIQPSAL